MNQVLDEISKIGIVPVVKLDRVEDASPLAKALCDGGLPCAEVTFRTSCAAQAIKIMTTNYPNMLVGAGTVLTIEQAEQAIQAGAKFIVSPGLSPKVVTYCIKNNIPVTPGCANPSDIEQAIELGLDVVKFFPAEAAGGLSMIKAMSAPYVNMKFMPTGGIHAKNLIDYLDFKKVIACGGSWMVKDDFIKSGDFKKITELTKEAVSVLLGFSLRHIGINTENDTHAHQICDVFCKMFGFSSTGGSKSFFAGNGLEIMKGKGPGTMGHIAIQTNSVDRAVYHLSMQGIEFDMDTATYAATGYMKFIYLKGEFARFGVHLIEK